MLAQREVTKRNAPSVSRPSLREGFATVDRGFADSPSMDCGKSGAIHRAARALARPDPAALRRGTEGPGSRAKKKLTHRVGLGPPVARMCIRANSRPSLRWAKAHPINALLLRQGLPRLRSSRAPLGRGEDAQEKARRGARTDARAFAAGQDDLSANLRSGLAKSIGHGCPIDRGREGVFSLVTFSCTSKRK